MQVFKAISENWFLSEPAYFALFCQQKLQENAKMECALRCGQGMIEYNPLLLAKKNYQQVEQLLRIEIIRLYLKHPYERQPEGCSREALALGSDCTIEDGYCFKEKLPLKGPAFYHLPLGQYYEWYAKHIENQKEKDNKDNETPEQRQERKENSSKSEHWMDDELRRIQINQIIEGTSDWGSMPGELIEKIKASTSARINNSYIMQGFRSSIISSQRQLTRMKPNRRTGFEQMGNTRQFDTSLLVAVDVSGSISSEQLADFYSSINRIFRFGITKIDCVQFDCKLGEITPMIQAKRDVEVKGRGGTSFQPIFDYISSKDNRYDGLLILTDGQAPPPEVSSQLITKVLWVCSDKQAYDNYHLWMEKTGRTCYL